MTRINDRYFMDDPREAGRLAEKVVPGEWVARYCGPHLPESDRVLDVGCGPGVIAAEVSRSCPALEVVGFDLSHERIAAAKERHAGIPGLSFEQGDVMDLPFTDGAFDLVYCRFLLEYLPDKSRAVSEMVRVLRPGGRIILQDLDGQLVWHYPVDPALYDGIERSLAALSTTGFDPFIGRKLYSLLHETRVAGLSVSIDPYHLHAGTIDDRNAALWQTKLDIARPAIEKAMGGAEEAGKLIDRFMSHLRDPATMTYSVVFTVTGLRDHTHNL